MLPKPALPPLSLTISKVPPTNPKANPDQRKLRPSPTKGPDLPDTSNGPSNLQQTQLSASPAASQIVKPKTLNEQMFRVKEYSPKFYHTANILCDICAMSQKFNISDYFIHMENVHSLYTCVYCKFRFKFSKALMVHLHREHRVLPQRFASVQDFVKFGGNDVLILCMDCNKTFPVSILSSHIKECKEVLPPGVTVQSPATNALAKIVKRKTEKEVPLLPSPVVEQKVSIVVPDVVQLDPLLLEPDGEKRLDMLIEQLAKKIELERLQEADQSTDFKIVIGGTVQNKSDIGLLYQLLCKSSKECVYCRQASIIRVDKRQLVIHLLLKHRWEIRTAPYLTNGSEIKEEDDTKTEVADEMVNDIKQETVKEGSAPEELTPVTSNSVENMEIQKIDMQDEIKEETTNLISKDEALVSKEEPLIAKNEPLDGKNETDKLIDDELPSHSVNTSLELTKKAWFDEENATEVNMIEFKLCLLRKVFHSKSKSLIFSYEKEDKGFGERSFECLLCNFKSDSQYDLFPHWRRTHRGLAMSCVMCRGRFLFVGALFSHLCFGSPEPFLSIENSKAINPHTNADSAVGAVVVDGGCYNSTISLRYQCGICKNDSVQLPGFFNYMVHLRKHHNTCELCLETMKNQKDLEHHVKKHQLNYFCWMCGVTYIEKVNFIAHLVWKHGTASKDCSVCLEKKWVFNYHFCIPPARFVCEICSLHFTKAKALTVHKRLHTFQNLKDCKRCHEKFISKKLLNKHITEIHDTKKIVPAIETTVGDVAPKLEEASPQLEEPKVKPEELNPVLEEQTKIEELNEMKDLQSELTEPIIKEDENQAPKTEENVNKEEDKTRLEVTPDLQNTTPVKEKIRPCPSCDEKFFSKKLLHKHMEAVHASSKSIQKDAEKPTNDVHSEEQKGEQKRVSSETTTKNVVDSYSVSSLHGPNLSEDEDEGDNGATDDAFGLSPVQPEPATSPLIPSAVDTPPSSCGSISTLDDITDEKINAPIPEKDDRSTPVVSLSPALKEDTPLTLLHHDEKSEPVKATTDSLTSDIMDLDEPLDDSQTADFEAMSPLLPPLEDYSCNLPEIPMFEDLPEHIRRENLVFSLRYEHDYWMRREGEPATVSLKRKADTSITTLFGKKSKPSLPKKVKTSKTSSPKKSRKRKHSSSSSSSSSSSCSSSCGSNCSCTSHSSSSSSSSSGSDEESSKSSDNMAVQKDKKKGSLKTKILKKVKKIPIKKLKVVKEKEPAAPKRPVGRPPKPKTGNSSTPSAHSSKKNIKPTGNRLKLAEVRMQKILKHFKKPEDAYILETDLDTDDSDSEEVYNKRQLEDIVTPVPTTIDQIWTEGNETFLLKFVKGVKTLEDLRPQPTAIGGTSSHSSPIDQNVKYTVFTKPEGNGKKQRLKVRNVPIMPLIVKRNLSDGQVGIQQGASKTSGSKILMPPPLPQTRKFMFSWENLNESSPLNSNPPHLKTHPRLFPGNSSSATKSTNSNAMRDLNNLPSTKSATQTKHVVNSIKVKSPFNLNTETTQEELAKPTMDSLNVVNASTIVPSSIHLDDASSHLKISEVESKPSPGPTSSKAISSSGVSDSKPKVKQPLSKNRKSTHIDETLYCFCQCPHDNISQMIGCDAKDCTYQWFHFECVGIITAPKGKWFCNDCRVKQRNLQAPVPKTSRIGHSKHQQTTKSKNGIDVNIEEKTNIGETSSNSSNSSSSNSKPHPTNCSSLLGLS